MPTWLYNLHNYELINRCCFKKLNLWQFVMGQQKTSKYTVFSSLLFGIPFSHISMLSLSLKKESEEILCFPVMTVFKKIRIPVSFLPDKHMLIR